VVRVEMPGAWEALAISGAIEAWTRAVYACNQYVDAQAPWALKKTDRARMAAVLATLFMCIRDLAVAISPVVPGSAGRLLDAMGVAAGERDMAAVADAEWYGRLAGSGFRLGAPFPVFPRLESDRSK
jgi:methionyl-tRNA synthetase